MEKYISYKKTKRKDLSRGRQRMCYSGVGWKKLSVFGFFLTWKKKFKKNESPVFWAWKQTERKKKEKEHQEQRGHEEGVRTAPPESRQILSFNGSKYFVPLFYLNWVSMAANDLALPLARAGLCFHARDWSREERQVLIPAFLFRHRGRFNIRHGATPPPPPPPPPPRGDERQKTINRAGETAFFC